ncbi:MAG: glycerophosphoryl diester phosphodiesterase membrane domain-containing protein [Chloroflexota bacterium]
MTTTFSPLLRPLSLAEILDQALRLYRNNFLKFIGILAIPYIPLIILQTGMSYLMTSSLLDFDPISPQYDPYSSPMFSASYWLGLLGTFGAAVLQFIFVQGVATAALTRAVADNYVGKPTDILSAYRSLGSAWWRLLLALLLALLVALVLFVWAVIPCVGWISGPGMLLFLFVIVMPLIAPVIVLEKHGALDSIQRAWNLSRIRFWWMVGFVVVLYIFGQIVVSGPTALATFLLQILALNGPPVLSSPLTAAVIQGFVTMIFSLVYLPLQLTAMTVVYFDLRIRSEGLDLALQTTQQPAEAGSAVSLPEITAAPQGSIITWTEVAYFVLISVGFVVLYFLLVGVLMVLMMGLLAPAL